MTALKVFGDIMRIAPHEAREMLETDFNQIAPDLRKADAAFSKEVEKAISTARALASLH